VKCPRCAKAANVENEMFCAHPLCPLPLPTEKLTEHVMDAAIKLQKAEQRQCECGAYGSGEGHTDWCEAEKFDKVPEGMSAEDALVFLQIR
jgi:hypothetical protein